MADFRLLLIPICITCGKMTMVPVEVDHCDAGILKQEPVSRLFSVGRSTCSVITETLSSYCDTLMCDTTQQVANATT